MLYFGRIAPEKGLETLIRAFARASTGARLLIAGSSVDGYQTRLERLADELAAESIEFVGHKDRRALDALIAACMFCVVPSEWYDNCPMSILEAFAHGKPVVAASIGGIPEQVADGSGMLFAPGDVDALAEALQTLAHRADMRERMGRNAHARLREAYSPETHCANLIAVLRECCEA